MKGHSNIHIDAKGPIAKGVFDALNLMHGGSSASGHGINGRTDNVAPADIAALKTELARYKTALAMIAGKVEFVQLADGRCEVRCEIEPDLYEVLGLVE